jgi:hypothetical protein
MLLLLHVPRLRLAGNSLGRSGKAELKYQGMYSLQATATYLGSHLTIGGSFAAIVRVKLEFNMCTIILSYTKLPLRLVEPILL